MGSIRDTALCVEWSEEVSDLMFNQRPEEVRKQAMHTSRGRKVTRAEKHLCFVSAKALVQ